MNVVGPFKIVSRPLGIRPKAAKLSISDQSAAKPVAWWKLDETEKSEAMDASGNSHTARVQGTSQWSPGQGRFNGALDFDGATNFLAADAPEFDFRDSLTVSLWIKQRESKDSRQTFVAKGASTWRLRSDDKMGKLAFVVDGVQTGNKNMSETVRVYSKRTVNDGQWHHVAAVYDGQRMALYLDGVLEDSKAASGPLAMSTEPLWIGRTVNGRDYFNGLMDDVRLYDQALSEEAIKSLYAQTVK